MPIRRTVDIPFNHYSYIIGPKGARVREITETTGVSVRIPKESGTEISVVGDRADVPQAIDMLLELSKEAAALGPRMDIEISVPRASHSYIIGQGGARIKKVMADTETRINMPGADSDSDVIKISGPLRAVEKAKKAILALHSERENMPITESVDIPKDHHRDIIGPRALNLRALEEKFGVRIHVPPSSKASERIAVSGSKDNIPGAIAELQKISELAAARPPTVKKALIVPTEHHSYLIGAKGARINGLMERTSTRVHIPSAKDESEEVVVEGQEADVEAAVAEIEKMVLARENAPVRESIEIPLDYQRYVAGLRRANLTRIEKETGIKIDFPPTAAQKTTVFLRAPKDNVEGIEKAKVELEKLCAEKAELPPTLTIEFDVPKDCHRYVIGARGRNVNRVMDETSTVIRFPPPDTDSEVVTIEGSAVDVVAARVALQALVDERQSAPPVEELSIKKDYHRRLIGAGGKRVQALMEESGAVIRFPPPNRATDMVSIQGDESQIKKAVALLKAAAKDMDAEADRVSAELVVPSSVVGYIIGPKGATIRDISESTGARIRVQSSSGDKEAGDRKVTIEGTPEALDAAKTRIQSIVDRRANQKTEKVKIPMEYHAALIGKGGQRVNRIKKESGCQVHIPPSAAGKDEIVIIGDESGIARALKMINGIVRSEEERAARLTITIEIPENQHVHIMVRPPNPAGL
jgi:polyribonucleotide nucleotidyltransferase